MNADRAGQARTDEILRRIDIMATLTPIPLGK